MQSNQQAALGGSSSSSWQPAPHNSWFRFRDLCGEFLGVSGSLGYENIGALVIRIGFGGISYYSHSKEPQSPLLMIKALTLRSFELRLGLT